MKLYFLFFLWYPIFLNENFNDTIYLINTDTMLNLDDGEIEELYFWLFLEGIIKQFIKLLG